MIDVIPTLITELKTISGFQKVYSPDFFVNEGEQIPLPSVSIVQRGGSESGYHRVLFAIRGINISQTRQLALETIDKIESMLITEFKWQKLNGGIEDKLEKGYTETFFYILFYEQDSD